MKYRLMFIDDGQGMPQTPEGQAVYARIGEWFQELHQNGKMKSGEELQPTRTATTVRFNGGKPVVTDGPFAEAKEVRGGYWMIDVESRDEAIAWAKRCPASNNEIIEIRQVQEMADFPADVQAAAAGFSELQGSSGR